MEQELERLLNDVKARVKVSEGENPMTNIQDALGLAYRNGLLYTYSQNGPNFTIRWRVDEMPTTVKTIHVCTTVCKRIVMVVPLPPEYDEEAEVLEYHDPDVTEAAHDLAKEYDIDVSTIVGTGTGARVIKRDVQDVIDEALDKVED